MSESKENEKQEIELKPFHESIIDILPTLKGDSLFFAATLLRGTKIPKNHDAIVKAWENHVLSLGFDRDTFGVIDAIRDQQAEIAREAARERDSL